MALFSPFAKIRELSAGLVLVLELADLGLLLRVRLALLLDDLLLLHLTVILGCAQLTK